MAWIYEYKVKPLLQINNLYFIVTKPYKNKNLFSIWKFVRLDFKDQKNIFDTTLCYSVVNLGEHLEINTFFILFSNKKKKNFIEKNSSTVPSSGESAQLQI